MSNTQSTAKLVIEGMHCGGCVQRVTNVLKAMNGVQVIAVEVGSATVTFHPAQLSPDQIAAAINRIGFPARVEA